MRSISWGLTACVMLFLHGCGPETVPVYQDQGPLFCDVESQRFYTADELEIRTARWPENVRLDLSTNTTWRDECAANREGQ